MPGPVLCVREAETAPRSFGAVDRHSGRLRGSGCQWQLVTDKNSAVQPDVAMRRAAPDRPQQHDFHGLQVERIRV
jgi:hypothetical protein